MENFHDPMRQVGYLQQCLSSNKKPLGLFLGAGCPMAVKTSGDSNSPLIPDIAGITEIVRNSLAKSASCGAILQVLEKQFKMDERTDTTVEDILTHVRALRAVAGKDKVRGLSAEELDKFDAEICHLIYGIADKTLPCFETPYHRIAAWAGALPREHPIEVFTTNYDQLVEQAFEDSRVPYFDGFAGARRPFFDLRAMEEDALPARWARLWKIHGSINWHQDPSRGVFRGMPGEGSSKCVIHPSHLKYEESRRMPYLAMMDRLRDFLKQPTSALVFCGYSFRDRHINAVLEQGLQYATTTMAFALVFGRIEQYAEAIALASKRTNLSVLALDGAIIGGLRAPWQEVESGLMASDNGKWVQWKLVDPANEEGKRKAEFALGDFAAFGEFLAELLGNVRKMQEV
ncbi:MAG: SIR2 family protein [Candidatus Brocadiia bacterium]